MQPEHQVRHRLFRDANQLPGLQTNHRSAARAASRRAAHSASRTANGTVPFDTARHSGSCRRPNAGQGEAVHESKSFNYRRSGSPYRRTCRRWLVWLLDDQNAPPARTFAAGSGCVMVG